MCLILWAHAAHPRYRLILAANRDEFYRRPTTAAAYWPDGPGVVGGRDLRAGGTWLALSRSGRLAADQGRELINDLMAIPERMQEVLDHSASMKVIARRYSNARDFLYLGRGINYPIALEGALKLKEISYIHAEAYPAGELKHGPLALVDANMPVVCTLPRGRLLEKVLSNLQEVRARGGELFLFSDEKVTPDLDRYTNLTLSDIHPSTAPIVFSVALQLLAYHVALLKGTDVDQPRNLAKSVTVE